MLTKMKQLRAAEEANQAAWSRLEQRDKASRRHGGGPGFKTAGRDGRTIKSASEIVDRRISYSPIQDVGSPVGRQLAKQRAAHSAAKAARHTESSRAKTKRAGSDGGDFGLKVRKAEERQSGTGCRLVTGCGY